MTAATDIGPGTELTSRRAVTAQDVAAVARITGDEGMHHVSGLAGRQVAQGLLTVAFAPLLRTEAGFRLETAQVTFLAPVFVGDTVACTVTVTGVDGPAVDFTLRICNQDDAEVAVGQGTGTLAGAAPRPEGAGSPIAAGAASRRRDHRLARPGRRRSPPEGAGSPGAASRAGTTGSPAPAGAAPCCSARPSWTTPTRRTGSSARPARCTGRRSSTAGW